MTPQEAWQTALDLLQQEMSRTAFNTWVQGAQFASYSDGTMTIRAADARSRDWLESHIASKLERLLAGILAHTVSIRFVADSPPEAELDDELILVQQTASESLYRTYVRPRSGLSYPVYLLRWLPYVGPKILWIVLALRYFAQRAGGNLVCCGSSRPPAFAAPYRQLQAMLGMDNETLKAAIETPEMGWFLERVNSGQGWTQDDQTGRIKRAPSVYRFTAYAPLTPRDADDLNAFLHALGLNTNPIAALDQALSVQPNRIFVHPAPEPRPSDICARPTLFTVQGVVRQTLGKRPDPDLFSTCMEKADLLAERLVGREALVSDYFLRNWYPVLGFTPAMMIVLLRSYTFVDEQTGDIHDAIWVENGLAELAKRMGVAERTLKHLFPAANPADHPRNTADERKHRLRESVSQFVTRGIDENRTSRRPWLFHIRRHDPLTETDRQRHAQAQRLILEIAARCEVDWIVEEVLDAAQAISAAQKSAKLRTSESQKSARLRTSPTSESANIRTSNPEKSAKLRTSNTEMERMLQELSVLQGLDALSICLKEHFLPPPEPGETPRPVPLPACANPDGEWDYRKLIVHNVKVPVKRQQLLDATGEAWVFVSWMLAAASKRQGQGIVNPVSLAISRVAEEPERGAGGVYDRLAQLPARELATMIAESLNEPSRLSSDDWKAAMNGTSKERLQMLADALGVVC